MHVVAKVGPRVLMNTDTWCFSRYLPSGTTNLKMDTKSVQGLRKVDYLQKGECVLGGMDPLMGPREVKLVSGIMKHEIRIMK